MENEIGCALEEIRRKKPLVHHITNYVTANGCANITLAIGASPVMADELEEVHDIVSISSALVLNIGTLNQRIMESIIAAGKKANSLGIPVVFDPVGAGASAYRNRSALRLMEEVKLSVVRGNVSEIGFIAGAGGMAKGVDASEDDTAAGNEARSLLAKSAAKILGCVAAITGPVDVISDGSRTIYIENGTKLLSGVTGTGCMCTSLIGAYLGAAADYLTAAAGGVLSMGIAGELAEMNADGKGCGAFQMGILDAIGNLNAEEIKRRAKIYEQRD
jgi:hydroxyethylthiazole kinase